MIAASFRTGIMIEIAISRWLLWFRARLPSVRDNVAVNFDTFENHSVTRLRRHPPARWNFPCAALVAIPFSIAIPAFRRVSPAGSEPRAIGAIERRVQMVDASSAASHCELGAGSRCWIAELDSAAGLGQEI